MLTVAELLHASGLPPLEARALLAQVLGCARETLIAHPQRVVAASAADAFERNAARRRAHEPLAYLLGEREFYGRRFAVSPAVLIPRPETELLVRLAVEVVADLDQPRVLDLGSGSGCIAVSIALETPHAEVLGSDISVAALEVARANAATLGAKVRFAAGDWFSAIDGRFDLIVSNPPYVAAGDSHLNDLAHEPRLALVGGADGLACVRPIIANAPAHLVSGGTLLVEHGYDQAHAVRALFAEAGFEAIRTAIDDAGLDRVTGGRLPR